MKQGMGWENRVRDGGGTADFSRKAMVEPWEIPIGFPHRSCAGG